MYRPATVVCDGRRREEIIHGEFTRGNAHTKYAAARAAAAAAAAADTVAIAAAAVCCCRRSTAPANTAAVAALPLPAYNFRSRY